ncbi:Rieske (2Fe-2S) protein [Paenibacillus humicola]|uniref:Rieske (2Fe-2S) protein n=1 Tax=Paenibacillus humicola TaxID=3110540 RepID=UPI00237AE78D|nr:Rieske 2Fe-2S domain-containing protein [Paenibacillus humicola]
MGSFENWIDAGTLTELREQGPKVVRGGIAVFYHEDRVYAVDNRCPHLGFPLHMGTLCDGILTCHWHHARFDICSGGTLDPWADDAPSHEVAEADGRLWVNPRPKKASGTDKYFARLREGLQQNIGIVTAKAVVGLIESGVPAEEIAKVGIEFGTTYGSGWNSGLTILTAMTRVLPRLDQNGQILALFQGLQHVARGSSGRAERHLLGPLPTSELSADRLTEWYRSCIEVRDTQGAQRVLLTAIRSGQTAGQLMDMMLTAVTDHFYLDGGHTLDFHNKAFEALEWTGPESREKVLSSLVPLLGNPVRSEEQHHWLAPLNLVDPVKEAFRELDGGTAPGPRPIGEAEEEALVQLVLSDRPLEAIAAITVILKEGGSPAHVAQLVALAAAERICRFHTQNDFGDWIAVLHTFTYAHAVHEALRRSSHPLVVRAVYYGAVSVYLDRFLNVPAAPKPKASVPDSPPDTAELLGILDKRQQVGEAASWVSAYLQTDGDRGALLNTLGHALLREDAEFHSFQMLEAAVTEYERWTERKDGFAAKAQETLLLAATRYLAAHAPTARELPHTARIAWRLHKGEKLFEDE